MIVNKYSILMLFAAGVGLVLAVVLAVTALCARRRIRRSGEEQGASRAERAANLASLVALVCLALLTIDWPLLYAMLDSFVPEVPGAMCIYGVARVLPITAMVVQTAGPAATFLLGAWVMLEQVHRLSGRPPQPSGRTVLLAAAAGLMAFSQGVQIYYICNMTSLKEVSCCSGRGERAAAVLQAPAYYLPWAIPAPTLRTLLDVLFFAGVPLLAWGLLVSSRRAQASAPGRVRARSALLLMIVGGLALASLLEFSAVLAPQLMRLPFHHCLYCLLFNGSVPDAPLMVANLMLGCFTAGWAAIVRAAIAGSPPTLTALRFHRRLCVLAATGLWASVLMVVMHLIADL